MSEKLCALRKIGGGIGKLTSRLNASSGNGSGSNVGGATFTVSAPHPYSTIRIIAKGGSAGISRLNINNVTTENPSINQDYDIKGKNFWLQIYASGSAAYTSAYFDFELS